MESIMNKFSLDFVKKVAASKDGEYDKDLVNESKQYLKSIEKFNPWSTFKSSHISLADYQAAIREIQVNLAAPVVPVPAQENHGVVFDPLDDEFANDNE